jgi:hypothetical protein
MHLTPLRGKKMMLKYLRNFGLFILSFIVLSSQVFAAADREVRLNELEQQMKQVATETAMGTYGANTAIARPEVDGKGWFASADVLYWKGRVGGTEYAFSDQDMFATLPIKGRKKYIRLDWGWGLRAGLGYHFDHDGWDFLAEYTWWEDDGSSSLGAGLNGSVVALKGSSSITQPDGPFVYCRSAKSQYDLDYQALDANLGRNYYVSSTVSFRPFWGLKAARIDLDQNTRYTGGGRTNIGTSSDPAFILGVENNTVSVRESCKFLGLGPRTGIGSAWYMGNDLSIFGSATGALLLGNFHVRHKENYSALEASHIELKASSLAFSPTVNFELGMRYDTYLHEGRHHLGIGVGVEVNYWWRQNQMLKVDNLSTLKFERYSEDIAFYGLTITGRWDF